MRKSTLAMTAITGALVFGSGFALAADQVQDQTRDQAKTQDQARTQDQTRTQDRTRVRTKDQIYGSQLMTRQERINYRAKMRSAKTAEEREKIRAEHHEQMKARAKERGMTLPDEPPARGGGMGSGGGMGPGSGMGPGGGAGMGGRNR